MASRDDNVLYLVLTPEFGGTRFGHFEQMEVRLGADPQRNNITLPESLGVAKEHVKVIRNPDNSLIIAPSERTAAVYVWKGDARRPTQIQTPTAVRAGDSFSVVTPDGPRFIIELGPLPAAVLDQRRRPNAGRRGFTAGKFVSEARRIFMARLYTFSPVQLLARATMAVQSGLIWQPRFIIGAIMLMSGWIMAAPAGCAALSFKSTLSATETDLQDCQNDLESVGEGGNGTDIEKYTIPQLAAQLTGVALLKPALEGSDQLKAAVESKARSIVGNPEAYEWMYTDSQAVNDFMAWRTRLEKTESLDEEPRRLMTYLAANRNRRRGDWEMVLDSQDSRVCGRGPVRMSYRQGKRLAMGAVTLDSYVEGDVLALSNSEEERWGKLKKTAVTNGEPDPEILQASRIENINQQSAAACLVAEGEDDREDLSKVVKMLVAQMGHDVDGLPESTDSKAAVARIAKFFLADVPDVTFDGTRPPVSLIKPLATALEDVPKKDWVLERTAEVIARSMVLPCEARLNYDDKKMEKVFGPLPGPLACLVLNYKLSKG